MRWRDMKACLILSKQRHGAEPPGAEDDKFSTETESVKLRRLPSTFEGTGATEKDDRTVSEWKRARIRTTVGPSGG